MTLSWGDKVAAVGVLQYQHTVTKFLQMLEPAHVPQTSGMGIDGRLPGHRQSGTSFRRAGLASHGTVHAGASMLGAPGDVTTWCPARMPPLAITCSTNEPLPRILQWIRYHQLLGFSLFYFFVEGHAQEPEVVDALRALVGVKVSTGPSSCPLRP